MDVQIESRKKTMELTLWILGVVGVGVVIANQNTIAGTGIFNKQYFAPFLVFSMALISLSLILKINRESKKKHFSIWNHLYEIIRTAGALAFAIYSWFQFAS